MNSSLFGTRAQQWVLSLLLPAFALSGQPLRANPSGGVVVHGQATINQVSASHLRINQGSQSAIINWTDFSIGAGELTQFVQPNSSASVLNRVTGGNVSQIYGTLQGNGNVFVVNTNGIVIGASGVVDVGGMTVLSTLDIDDQDFLDGGPSRFYGDSTTGVTNFGTISSREGDVVLLGGFVDNQGQIGAMNGTVALGSGGDILLEQANGAKITVRGTSDYEGTGVNNAGTVTGAAVEMKAHGNVYALAINNTGMVRATGATRANGRVRLMASGSSSNINLGNTSQLYARNGTDGGSVQVQSVGGNVTNAGAINATGSVDGGSVAVVGNTVTTTESSVIEASGVDEGGMIQIDSVASTTVSGVVEAEATFGTGGRVEITGAEVELAGVTEVSVDGRQQGGSLRIGGEFQGRDDLGLREADFTTIGREAILRADARAGDAGSIIVWANQDTMYLGEASASALGMSGDGGLIEISGYERLAMRGDVAATSVNGRAGTVLFDPETLTVGYFNNDPAAPFNSIEIADINRILQGGTSVLLMTSGAGSDIVFQDVELAGASYDFGGQSTNGSIQGITNDAIDASIAFDDANHPRNSAIQWTNSNASFGAFAGGSIILNNHIRTSGEGSINLIAGWGGSETDDALSVYIDGVPGPGRSGDLSGLAMNGSLIGQDNPQNLFRTYVSAGQFGENNGSIFVGESGMTRHVEVGSRYGDTNLAGFNIFIAGADTNDEERYAQVGFRDSGSVFSPRKNDVNGLLDLDLNNGDLLFDAVVDITGFSLAGDTTNQFEVTDIASSGLVVGQKVELSGIRNTLTTETYVIASIDTGNNFFTVNDLSGNPLQNEDTTPNNSDFTNRPDEVRVFKDNHVLVAIAGQNEVDRNGDGLVDGVNAVNHTGGVTDTFVSYANHFNSARVGNYWWQQIQAETEANFATYNYNSLSDAQADRGGNRPEMGAGTSASDGADINIIAKGNVEITGGGRTASSAMVGHGGHSAGWAQDRSIRDDRFIFGQTPYYYSINGAHNDRSGVSIGRLAPVYGNINVFAGVEEVSAIDTSGNVVATVGQQGNVILRGIDRMGSANNPTNEEQGNGTESPVQIGHGGVGQFGIFEGDISVTAAGSVEVRAGSQSRNSAVIGHNINGYQYWDPTDTVDQQIRFFSSAEDFDDPLLRRGELFSGSTNIIGQTATGDTFTGTRLRALSDPGDQPLGTTVEALDGSIEKGFYGDIEVTAANGRIDVIGFSTPDRSDGTVTPGDDDATVQNGLNTNRDRRYAQIGHGGSTFSVWSEGSGYNPNNGNRNIELVQYRVTNTDSGSASVIGETGSSRNRALTFMTISGDISVDAGGDLRLEGGNDQYAYAHVGHGGAELADLETSSFINGDINVNVGGAIEIQGGGAVTYTGNADNRQIRAYAMIGHGGVITGFMGHYGNINVTSGGDVTLTGGAYDNTFAKIGHQGGFTAGQTGGDFLRNENFRFDSAETNITTEIVGSNATVTYAAATPSGLTYSRSFNDISTTNISVTSEGSITMNHLGEGIGFNDNQDLANRNRANTLDMIDNAPVQIGHGGIQTDGFRLENPANDFDAKIGDITVIANGGDITLENGNGDQRWTRIGHGIGRNETGNFDNDSLELAGDIRVEASGDVILNADAADLYGRTVNAATVGLNYVLLDIGDPSRWNPVSIGHGGAFGNNGLIVLDTGMINGQNASSDISVVAGRDITVAGGKGAEGNSAQIGHGFSDFEGNSTNRKNGQPDGFAGDISVSSGRNITVKGGDLATYLRPLLATDQANSILGAYGVIGHGGFGVDAEAHGNINVYAGNDLAVVAQQRTQAGATAAATEGYVYTPPTTSGQPSNVSSLFNFAKIGHSNAENGNAVIANNNDAITNATQTGDITVVVDNNFSLVGGTTIDESAAPVSGAFAQVGHGGPGISGNEFTGDITVLVRNNITATGGTPAVDTQVGLNNYAMIGNGDRVRDDGVPDVASVFFSESQGARNGDITVAAGNNATFTNALVGHADPSESSQLTSGVTRVAVSRNNPFFGGSGTLTSTGSVFSSGGNGGERLEFYMPARSSNEIDATTRLNEANATYTSGTPGNFVGLDGSGSETSGRDDEVYLTPDLWWDAAGFGAANGFNGGGAFPTDATSGQGGGIAEVSTPGGFPNIVSLTQGALGSSATTYRTANGVNGVGSYTFFYDAVEPTEAPSIPIPVPPTPPEPVPFDFALGISQLGEPAETYEAFDRDQEFLEDGVTGGNFGNGALGMSETDSSEFDDNGPSTLEDRLDNLFGPRRDSFSEEEEAEEEEARRRRGSNGVGTIGLTFYVFDPNTNRYSSFRVFGTSFDQFYPAN